MLRGVGKATYSSQRDVMKCSGYLHAKKKMLMISNRLLIISTPVGQQRQLLLSSIFVLWLSLCTY